MSILEELYYGNIRPSLSRATLSRRVRYDTACTLRGSSSPHRAGRVGVPVKPQSVETRKALSEITEIEEALGEIFTNKEQKEKIAELSERYNKLITLTERDGILQGFRLGAKLMVELMSEND